MSFLKIRDPLKREQTVKEYLATRKRIRDSQLAEKTGEIEIKQDLSKFFEPITETQKAATKEITEELKPIKEGIEQLPQAIKLPNYPTIEAYPSEEKKIMEEYKEKHFIGPIAKKYLTKFIGKTNVDRIYGLYDKDGKFYIGNKLVIIDEDDIIVGGKVYQGTPGLWELIVAAKPNPNIYKDEDFVDYQRLIIKSNALYRDNGPTNPHAEGGYQGEKWKYILKNIWAQRKRLEKEYEEKGLIVIPSDPNALLERLDLLMASKKAGNTGVKNELISICDELKRQGVLKSSHYKNLMTIL